MIEGVTDAGVYERAPLPRVRYVAYADAASGAGQDSFAVAVAHRESDATLMLDAVRERPPRFVPDAVVAEYATLLKSYCVTSLRRQVGRAVSHQCLAAQRHQLLALRQHYIGELCGSAPAAALGAGRS